MVVLAKRCKGCNFVPSGESVKGQITGRSKFSIFRVIARPNGPWQSPGTICNSQFATSLPAAVLSYADKKVPKEPA
jgi:hypothetical protein